MYDLIEIFCQVVDESIARDEARRSEKDELRDHCELGAVYSSNFRNNINIKSQDPDSSIYDGWQPGSAI